MQDIREVYHNQLKARISNLLNSSIEKPTIVFHAQSQAGLPGQSGSVGLTTQIQSGPPGIVHQGPTANSNMEILESQYNNSTDISNVTATVQAGNTGRDSIMDLQLANIALLLVLVLLLGGTIYYWFGGSNYIKKLSKRLSSDRHPKTKRQIFMK